MRQNDNVNVLIYAGLIASFLGVFLVVHSCIGPPKSAYNSPSVKVVKKVMAPVTLPESVVSLAKNAAPKKETVQPCDPQKDWPSCGAVLWRNGEAERP